MPPLVQKEDRSPDVCNRMGIPLFLEDVKLNPIYKRNLAGLLLMRKAFFKIAEDEASYITIDSTPTGYSANTIRQYISQGLAILKKYSSKEEYSTLRDNYAVKISDKSITLQKKEKSRLKSAIVDSAIREVPLPIEETKHLTIIDRINNYLSDLNSEDHLTIENVNFSDKLLEYLSGIKEDGMIHSFKYIDEIKTLVILRTPEESPEESPENA